MSIQKEDFCIMKKKFIFLVLFVCQVTLFAQNGAVESTSKIDWTTRAFVSDLSLDTNKAQIKMPSGKKIAAMQIKSKMAQLIQPPLLSLYSDSNTTLSDMVIQDNITLDDVFHFIMNGYKTPDVFSQNLLTLQTENTTNVNQLGSLLVRHKTAYSPEKPIELIASRPYTGILIDARGSYPVHGEYVSSKISPCFFPTIWDDKMDIVYEKNYVTPEIVKKAGLVAYHYLDDLDLYEDRIGADPLYIKATEVYGRNRTDPVIKHDDALKILTVPENLELLKQGKVVILLDKENLIYNIATPEKDEQYYVQYNSIKQYFYENKVNDITVSDSINGILFSVDLKFYPDSPELLPGELARIEVIAQSLKKLLTDDGYTILVEGHTADVGKPKGQLNLSIERTETVMHALIDEGLAEKLFTYKGYGGTKPVATNETEEGRAQNRRVDITARPRATYIQRDWN